MENIGNIALDLVLLVASFVAGSIAGWWHCHFAFLHKYSDPERQKLIAVLKTMAVLLLWAVINVLLILAVPDSDHIAPWFGIILLFFAIVGYSVSFHSYFILKVKGK